MKQTIQIGDAYHRSGRKPFAMELTDRLLHMYIVGQTGAGKSTLMGNLARQDAARPPSDAGFSVVWPHFRVGSVFGSTLGADFFTSPFRRMLWWLVMPSYFGRDASLHHCHGHDRILGELEEERNHSKASPWTYSSSPPPSLLFALF